MISVSFVIVIYRIHNHKLFQRFSKGLKSEFSLDMTGLDQISSDFKSLASTNSATPAQVFARFKNALSKIGATRARLRRMLTVSFKNSKHQRRLNPIIVGYTIKIIS
jgi:hypothetical protein